MSSIPLPALDVRPQQGPDPMEHIGRFVQLKALMNQESLAPLRRQQLEQEVKTGQQEMEQRGMQLQQQKQSMQDMQTIRQTMQDNPGATYGDILPKLRGKINPTQYAQLAEADTKIKQGYATLDETGFKNAKSQHDAYQGIYDNVMNMPDQQVQQNWPQIAQSIASVPGNKIPVDPNKPMTKDQIKQFSPMIDMNEAYLANETSKREKKAEADLKQKQAEMGGTDQEIRFESNYLKSKNLPDTPANRLAAQRQYNQETKIQPAIVRADEFAKTRGVSAMLDTKSGIVGPVSWDEINRAQAEEPGRYQSPQFGQTGERKKFLDQYENPAGRAAINRQAINNILQHAGDLSDVNKEYRRFDMRFVNMAMNKMREQYSAEWTKYETPLTVLKDEIGLYFAGGYAPTSEQLGMWDKIQKDEATPAQTEQFAKSIVHVGLRRAHTFNEQYKKNMGYDDPNMIVPDAKAAAGKLGMTDEVSPFGSGGQYTPNIYGTQPNKPPTTQPAQPAQPQQKQYPGVRFKPLG